MPTRRTRYTDFLIDHAPPPPALLLAFGGEYGLRRALDENREMVWRALEELEAGPPCREARA
ncbi:MAG: hypothetical protein V2J02_18780 [Pseudomonadales bacterium]|nr:hypothetical protein [Pseudomonadales bacterium]